MNHLAHFALAGSDKALMVGGFLGDFVKGRLQGQYPEDIERGIRLHRAIDRYTDQHAIARRSVRRLPARFHRYGGIITDIAYDHLLARNWPIHYDMPLEDFSLNTLETLLAHRDHLPEHALKTAERMHEVNALAGYIQPMFVERSLGYLSTRLKRENPLDEAAREVMNQQELLTLDLNEFFPEVREFCAEWIQSH